MDQGGSEDNNETGLSRQLWDLIVDQEGDVKGGERTLVVEDLVPATWGVASFPEEDASQAALGASRGEDAFPEALHGTQEAAYGDLAHELQRAFQAVSIQAAASSRADGSRQNDLMQRVVGLDGTPRTDDPHPNLARTFLPRHRSSAAGWVLRVPMLRQLACQE